MNIPRFIATVIVLILICMIIYYGKWLSPSVEQEIAEYTASDAVIYAAEAALI